MFDHSHTRFHDKSLQKAAQYYTVSKVSDMVKFVALWSANIRKLAKDHKGYGSAAMLEDVLIQVSGIKSTNISFRCTVKPVLCDRPREH